MKSGRSLQELAAELQRRSENKHDYDVLTRKLRMTDDTNQVLLPNGEQYDVTRHAHSQVATKLGIPWKYYDRMRTETPQLLASNVNHWFENAPPVGKQNKPEQRLVRTLDGNMRAYLGCGYMALDNWDLAQVVADELAGMDAVIKSCEVTDNRLYLQIVTPKIQGEIRKGDVVQSGLIVSNSEIGMGSLMVEPLVYRLVCLNGLIVNDAAFKRRHITSRMEGLGEDGDSILKDTTKRLIDAGFWATVRDVVSNAVSETGFDGHLRKFVESTEVKIENDPLDLVERVQSQYQLTDTEKRGVLKNLLIEGDMTKFGLVNAVTAVANEDKTDYDRAVELERLGGTILDAPKGIWEKLDATKEDKK